MKLTRAIQIMETKPPESASISDKDEERAANLAIQAMKELLFLRSLAPTTLDYKLPGETHENPV